jgi:hypothetical protein
MPARATHTFLPVKCWPAGEEGTTTKNVLFRYLAVLVVAAAAQAQSPAEQEEFFSKIFAAMGIATGSIVADIGTRPDPVHARRMAKIVGPSGKVVCVDITETVIEQLRTIFKDEGVTNVEVRLG